MVAFRGVFTGMTYRRRPTKQPEADIDAMRCVVDEKGSLVFASPALGWSLGQNAHTLAGKPVSSILSIEAPLGSRHQSTELQNIESGFYEVALLRQDRDPLMVQARIDRVGARAPEFVSGAERPGAPGQNFLVIWLDPDNKLKRQKHQNFAQVATDFATFISTNQTRVVSRDTSPAPALDHISKNDGELKHFLNITHDLLGVYSRDLSFVRVNPSFNRVLGFSDAELKSFPFSDLIHPEDRPHVLPLLQKAAAADGEAQPDFECQTRCKDGHFRRIEWAHKASGEHIYLVGRDVTDIRRHEAELQRREQQLSEAQKIGRMGHWFWEMGQSTIEWSDQIYSIFGVEKGRFVPTIDSINALLLKRDLGRIHKAFQRAIVRKRDYAFEFRLRRPKGGIRFVRCEGRCKVDPKTGETEALFGIMQDITERTLHERALQEAKEAAEQAYASKTRFLANMSHELRTPLNAIIGFSEMMQRQLLGPVGNARYLDYIGGIRESGEHLLDLINDILDMSKIEIGKYELYVEEMNIGKIIRLAVHMIEGRAHEAQVRLITDDLPDDIQVTADRRALMQILLNLLSNAVKFTNPGGSVEVRCLRELGGIAIAVTDTGIGIPKDKLEVVTLPFEQAGSELTRKYEGSGLGLAITKDLIELHGGTLDIESELGVGTTVTVTLPDKIPEQKSKQPA